MPFSNELLQTCFLRQNQKIFLHVKIFGSNSPKQGHI